MERMSGFEGGMESQETRLRTTLSWVHGIGANVVEAIGCSPGSFDGAWDRHFSKKNAERTLHLLGENAAGLDLVNSGTARRLILEIMKEAGATEEQLAAANQQLNSLLSADEFKAHRLLRDGQELLQHASTPVS